MNKYSNGLTFYMLLYLLLRVGTMAANGRWEVIRSFHAEAYRFPRFCSLERAFNGTSLDIAADANGIMSALKTAGRSEE